MSTSAWCPGNLPAHQNLWVPVSSAASEAATQAAAAAPKFTQGSALDAYLEATKSAKKGFKAPVPEPPSGSSVQDGLSSAQEAATSAISSLTEGDHLSTVHISDACMLTSHTIWGCSYCYQNLR